jgi:hypothetical protein
MATPRTKSPRARQVPQKRVKEIAEEAASKIAAESLIEEHVVVTVEEFPPDDTPGTTSIQGVGESFVAGMTLAQRFVGDGVDAWLQMTTSVLPSGGEHAPWLAFDPRSMVEASFAAAEELLAAQKESVLRLISATHLARTA